MRIRGVVVCVVLGVSIGCSGHPEPAGSTQGGTVGLMAASAFNSLNDSPVLPVNPAACPLGKGEPDAVCSQGGLPELLAQVDAAIDTVVHERPELFDLERVV